MYRFSACVAVGAMLFALVSAPLLHVHDHDDDHAESLVHAHFPESDHDAHSGYEVERHHTPEHGRSIDLFAVNTSPSAIYHAVLEFSEPFSIDSPIVSRAVLSVLALRAHSPPERFDLPPRSPPTV